MVKWCGESDITQLLPLLKSASAILKQPQLMSPSCRRYKERTLEDKTKSRFEGLLQESCKTGRSLQVEFFCAKVCCDVTVRNSNLDFTRLPEPVSDFTQVIWCWRKGSRDGVHDAMRQSESLLT